MAVEMIPVQSEAAREIGYEAQTGTIHVEFNSGRTHPFGPFSREEFEAFRDADSIGKRFHRHIKAKAVK